MPSFSSFVRKPGKVAAPKRIPRRKVPPTQRESASEQGNLGSDATNDAFSATHNQTNGTLSNHEATEIVQHAVHNDSRKETDHVISESDILNNTLLSQDQEPQFLPSQSVSISNALTNQTNPQIRSSSQTVTNTADEVTTPPMSDHEVVPTEAPLIIQQEPRDNEGPSDHTSESSARNARSKTRRKAKRKPNAKASVALAEPAPITASTNATDDIQMRPTTHSDPSPSSPTSTHAEVFQQITSRLQNGIERFRASQTPSRAGSVAPIPDSREIEREANGDTLNSRPRKRHKRNNDQAKTIQEQVAEVIAHATGNEDLTPRHRRGTPEDAEEHEIEVETITLSELCDDHKWGKKSNREKEMAANWPEILRRRKEENEERMQKAEERRSRKRKEQPADGDTELVIPEQAIVNGEIVAAGRIIDNRAQIVLEANDESRPVLEARDIFNRVTQDTIAPKRRLPPGQMWDEVGTDLFYQGLSMFGTDFNMIANMIPGKNRRQVKLKYNMEERNNWSKVKTSLNKNQNVSLDQYADMTGLTFGSVEDLYKELEEDEKRIRAEDEARRKEEGIISQAVDGEGVDGEVEADIAVPSIEVQESEQQPAQLNSGEVQSDRARSTATTRLGSVTTGGRQTAQPPGANRKKPARKTNPNSKRGRQAANKRNNLEGIEESLGPADQVTVPVT